MKIRFLTEDEKVGAALAREEDIVKPNSMRLRKEEFLKYGFTEGCPGCRSLIRGGIQRQHWTSCRQRIEAKIVESPEGADRKRKQKDREDEFLAEKLRLEIERNEKKAKHSEGDSSGSGDLQKRQLDTESDQEGDYKKARQDEVAVAEMELSLVERLMQEDMKWEILTISNLCQADDQSLDKYYDFDENSWEPLDNNLVKVGEKEEMDRFKKMGVYRYVDRRVALNDPDGNFVKVKWVGSMKGNKVRCRLVVQELGYGEKVDELFADTPPLMAVKLALAMTACRPKRMLMVLDVKCAFLYGSMRRKVYIELPQQDDMSRDSTKVGLLLKAMYGSRDAPQIWQSEVKAQMTALGFAVSVLQPSVYFHNSCGLYVVAHVDDFLCSGEEQHLDWLHDQLRQQYDLTVTKMGSDHEKETKYLNRTLRWTQEGIQLEGDPKHADMVLNEWGMNDCKCMDTPMSQDLERKMGTGELLSETESKLARRTIARFNYMAQDLPDLSVVSRLLSSCMSQPTGGTQVGIKRVLRYIKKYPRCVNVMKFNSDMPVLRVFTDSDWAGDQLSRKSTSGGFVQLNGQTIAHWSKLQSNVALSSGEAELNAAVKGLSEVIGAFELLKEMTHEEVQVELLTDASACKGMLLRHGVGKVKHLSTKQLWSQGAVEAYGIVVKKIPRLQNGADCLTHLISAAEIEMHLKQMNFVRG